MKKEVGKLAKIEKEIYEDLDRLEKENKAYNSMILDQIILIEGKEFLEKLTDDLIDIIDFSEDLDIYDKLEIVDTPKGKLQEENGEVVKEAYVEQHCTNMEGDSFYGFYSIKLSNNKYLQIPFSC
jgi:hypothetical protein